ncbi:MAG TPA: transglycosylase SLT domain-containing protein [Bryobacteraceae bacterium]|nr:transglycosylase SLT domain-containing protein [Bryobacteraceae bacterium]
MAKTIPAPWYRVLGATGLLACVGLWGADAVRPADLASLVRAYRDSATPARRAAVQSFAAAHSKETSGALAQLALGVVAYEHKDYPAAIAALRKVQKLPQIADYTAWYLAASRVELSDNAGVATDLAPTHNTPAPSPFSARAWVLEARALETTQPAEAARILREHYAELPQPEGDVTLADCYRAANDPVHAADFYQRVYYQFPTGAASTRAGAALLALQDSMGDAYPPPIPRMMLRRPDRLMEIREYALARSEYRSLVDRVAGLERDQARVRVGEADFLKGSVKVACSYLRGLDLAQSEADAERLYEVGECARREGDDGEMMSAVERLGRQYPDSPWRLKALVSAANRYLLVNRPDDYLPLYRAAYQDFPADPAAGACHWKVTFHAYMQGQADAGGLLREHLRNYPAHFTAGAALYFLGRQAEQESDFATARACYQRLLQAFENHYYAMLARERLRSPEVAGAAPSPETARFLAAVTLPQPKPVPLLAASATTARIDRSRLLRTAGLGDLADSELRFGARIDGQPPLLAMEMAEAAAAPHLAMRIMKSLTPEYLNLPLDQAPRRFWELLFPLPYRADLVRAARTKNLDPYLLAGLIRQESEFDPQARSRANALGLTQVRPVTGRLFARQAGVGRFNNRLLFQPAANLMIGVSIFASMLEKNGGKLEQTLAAYNAGPNRAAEWSGWNNYREPAEFVESIPFTETRDYVQAVLRNADLYRRLYAALQ